MSNRFQTLTLDSHRFPLTKMRALVDKMNAAGQQWVPIHVRNQLTASAAAAADDHDHDVCGGCRAISPVQPALKCAQHV